MASDCSFDVVSKVDMPEVKNAINQAMAEIAQRYDFKGSKSEISLDEKSVKVSILSDDEVKLKAVVDIFQSKSIKRGVPIKNFSYGKTEKAAGGLARQEITIEQGIVTEKAKSIVKAIKDAKLKVQASIQQDQVRVSGKKRDDLQQVISLLKERDFGITLQFSNYR
ncbi:MAG: YajQ family cyclic di-GMP-binding protein [Nitrospinota bacterium]